MTGQCADIMARTFNGEKVAMMFIDGSGVGSHAGVIVARLHQMGYKNVIAINFGDEAFDAQHYVYRRDEMWGLMKDWLRTGAIDDDKMLAADLQKPALMSDVKGRVKLEPKDMMKKRLKKIGMKASSPDDADGLALTFAMPVAQRKKSSGFTPPAKVGVWS